MPRGARAGTQVRLARPVLNGHGNSEREIAPHHRKCSARPKLISRPLEAVSKVSAGLVVQPGEGWVEGECNRRQSRCSRWVISWLATFPLTPTLSLNGEGVMRQPPCGGISRVVPEGSHRRLPMRIMNSCKRSFTRLNLAAREIPPPFDGLRMYSGREIRCLLLVCCRCPPRLERQYIQQSADLLVGLRSCAQVRSDRFVALREQFVGVLI